MTHARCCRREAGLAPWPPWIPEMTCGTWKARMKGDGQKAHPAYSIPYVALHSTHDCEASAGWKSPLAGCYNTNAASSHTRPMRPRPPTPRTRNVVLMAWADMGVVDAPAAARDPRATCPPSNAREAAEKERSGQLEKHAWTNAVSATRRTQSTSCEPRRPRRTAVVRRPAAASSSRSNVWIQSCYNAQAQSINTFVGGW